MRLSELLGQNLTEDALEAGLDKSVEILGMTADSRHVLPGYMFAALPGSMVDGAKYIGDAVKNGARVVHGGGPPREIQTHLRLSCL